MQVSRSDDRSIDTRNMGYIIWLYYKTYERHQTQPDHNIWSTCKTYLLSAQTDEDAPQDVGGEQDCRLGEIENASP